MDAKITGLWPAEDQWVFCILALHGVLSTISITTVFEHGSSL